MESEKVFKNKELIIPESDFNKSITNDFIGDDFIEQLEWAMMITQSKFKQIKFAEHLPEVRQSHFDKAFLMSSTLNESQQFCRPFSDMQVSPDIIKNLNIKIMNINETITLSRVREMDLKSKRHLKIKQPYAFERSVAFYKKDTESFYGKTDCYEIGKDFFALGQSKEDKVKKSMIPNPVSMHPNYVYPDNAWTHLSQDEILDIMRSISMSYQVAMSMYYEWNIYIKEYDNLGIVVPISTDILKDLFSTSMVNFDSKKRMLHFVRDHYRKKPKSDNNDFSVYVNRYLRGENKFNYRGFFTEIIPPQYDILRAKTKKKFSNIISE